jgi:hypothetical protein
VEREYGYLVIDELGSLSKERWKSFSNPQDLSFHSA